ncbi:MAG: type II secretion system protein N [Pseudomonadota bacterium]|nr:type II secretion system protein N [Pseudomonadota bacterium]
MAADPPFEPWLKRATAAGCALLVIATAFVLVKLVYLFVDTSVGTAPALYNPQARPFQPRGSVEQVNTAVIARWSLFGKEGQKPQPVAQQEDVNAPKTRLSLELQAVFVAPVEERSSAMIAESRRDSELYHIGDEVPGNVTLAAVYPDRVLLNRSGKLEALYFPDNAEGGFQRSTRTTVGSRSRRDTRVTAARRAPSRPGFADGSASMANRQAQAAMAEQMVSTLKEQIAEDPAQLLGQFGLAPNNGRGYRVADNPNPMLAAVGARPGDVILAVNGQSVGDPAQDINLIEEVIQDGSVRVSMERNGRQFDSEYALPGL